ncbi:hypothetical protein PINS_up011909 [Pythium insidiosum]|nr:hypothetical protein PINS_up011909 [Pythium insidiosum]
MQHARHDMTEQVDASNAALSTVRSPQAAHLAGDDVLMTPSGVDTREAATDESLVVLDDVDGEAVGPHDDVFGLGSSDEIAMNMGMTLHAMQQLQDALLSRSTSAEMTSTSSVPTSEVPPPTEEDALVEAPVANVTVTSTAAPAPIPCSRREDKIRQFQEHPIVAGVSPDGRVVQCKCGKHVRLNPPWYILKYEQHLVSRNCTFLRVKKSARKATKLPQRDELSSTTNNEPGGPDDVSSDAGDGSGASVQDKTQTCHDPATENVEAGCPLDTRQAPENASAHSSDTYGLKTLEELRRLPDTESSQTRLSTLSALATDTHFGRATPDGRFFECRCSELIILSTAWDPREFYRHVAAKKAKPAASRRKGRTQQSTRKPKLGDGAALRISQRLSSRDFHWLPVSDDSVLPCPGIRDDERVAAFIASTTQITGGSRPRRRIAEELFPHVTSASGAVEHNDRKDVGHEEEDADADDGAEQAGGAARKPLRLSSPERLLLHDAIESEALWLIDRDAGAVRSLDCKGTIAVSRKERLCATCSTLRANTSLRVAMNVASQRLRKMAARAAMDVSSASTNGFDAQAATGVIRSVSSSTKHTVGKHFAVLEQTFNMEDEFARILRDLFTADVEDGSAKNIWFDAADMGIHGLFDSHPAYLGLVEAMIVLKDKERRGVGRQNMSYSEQLDAFMRTLSDVSPEACDLFQHHLGGRKQKYLVGKRRRAPEDDTTLPSARLPLSSTNVDVDQGRTQSVDSAENANNQPLQPDALSHYLQMSPPINPQQLGESELQEMDLSAPYGSIETHLHAEAQDDGSMAPHTADEMASSLSNGDGGAILPSAAASTPTTTPALPTHRGILPCRGLRDEKVQAYVTNAVQLIGGSRPKYVIARELFPEVFDGASKVKITEKLTESQRLILQDAIFSECLWRVDKTGGCVRSLRCMRSVAVRRQDIGLSQLVCRACLGLKSVANFRSLLSRAKTPKNVENLKYMPTAYTESDPILRQLSKNASLRTLYQTVQRNADADPKKVTFWLRFAKLGLFGYMRSHPVFEGLVASMVEVKDKERRGVGKQNMQYAKALDDFMNALAAVSMDAFELFSLHFCGRTTRSQKVKKRKADCYSNPSSDSAMSGDSLSSGLDRCSVSGDMALATSSALALAISAQATGHAHNVHTAAVVAVPPHSIQQELAVVEAQHLMSAEDLLGARSLSTADMEESQRIMDRMLNEVHLSVGGATSEALTGPPTDAQSTAPSVQHHVQLDAQTYLDENGVLTTML